MWKRNRKKVIVSSGVDIRSQMTASKKGMFFPGNDRTLKTFFLGKSARPVWDVKLTDMNRGTAYSISFSGQMYIGRKADVPGEVSLSLADDSRISKLHCRIYEYDDRLCIEDLHSKNHTYVNEKRCDVPIWLDNNCIIKIGNTRLKVKLAVKRGGR